jgi:hypothetical protein
LYCFTYRKNKLLFYNSFNLFLLHGLKATDLFDFTNKPHFTACEFFYFYFSSSLVFFKAKATHQMLYLTEIKSPSGISKCLHGPFLPCLTNQSVAVKKHPQYTVRRAPMLHPQFAQPPCVAGDFARQIYVPNTPQPGQLDLIRYST